MNPKIDTAAEREEAEAAAFVDAEYAAADKYLADEWSHYAITDETRAIVRSAWAERAKQSAPFASAAPAAVAPAHIDADKLQRWEAALECGALWASGSEGYSRISRALRDSEAREIPAELFDGYSVYSALTDGQKESVSHEAVSAVLDATVRVIRASRALKELDRSSGAVQQHKPEHGEASGTITCPKCGGKLNFVIQASGISRGHCPSAGCVRWCS